MEWVHQLGRVPVQISHRGDDALTGFPSGGRYDTAVLTGDSRQRLATCVRML